MKNRSRRAVTMALLLAATGVAAHHVWTQPSSSGLHGYAVVVLIVTGCLGIVVPVGARAWRQHRREMRLAARISTRYQTPVRHDLLETAGGPRSRPGQRRT